MKKSMLAMSVAAAIGGLGFAGSALAITTVGGATADTLELNPNGIGHQLVVPYFSTQSGNATLLNIVNTDTINGKLVKVRFRGAGNSDDLFDFQVLMSPGDVWTAAVTQDANGASKLSTADKSCAIGLGNGVFSTLRTDPTKTNAETREGYVEFINMADIPVNTTTGSLYTAIKHVDGIAPCTASVLAAQLGTDVADVTAAATRGLTPPSTGLTGDWILLNQTTTAAWSGAAAALEARAMGVSALGNVVFWPQKFGDVANAGNYTADPLLVGTAPVVAPQQYDLPDLSTPYVTGSATPAEQADNTTAQLAVTSVANQFETSEGIAAVTDWLFSQPTRRYHVAVNYNGTGTAAAVYRAGSNYYNVANTGLYARQICLDTTFGPGRNSLFDREETTPGVTDSPFVPSPNLPEQAEILLLCGEANVVSINADGVAAASALGATVARGDISTDYTSGWARWDLNNGAFGVPVLGASFMRAANGAVNYGFAFPHKTTRPAVN